MACAGNHAQALWFSHSFCAIASVVMMVCDAQASPILRVEMKPLVQTSHLYVSLSDVANLSSPDLNTLKRVMSVSLGRAPRAGETVALESASVERWMRGLTGLGTQEVQWSGAQVTQVSTAVFDVSGDEVVTVAQTALRQHLESKLLQNDRHSRVELQAIALPSSFVIPASATSLVARPIADKNLSKRVLVWVDVFADGRVLRSVPVRFEVSVYAPAPVATSPLLIGSSVQATDVQTREVDITQVQGIVATTPASNQRLVRPVQSGEVITQAHLKTLPTVVRGELAQLTSQSGLVTLESQVEVLQDGQIGQLVRVKATSGTGAISARVTGPGRLEIQP